MGILQLLWHVLFNLTNYLYACLCFCFSVVLLSLIFHIALVHCSVCFPHPSASLLHLLSISDLLESCLGSVQSLDYFLCLNKIILQNVQLVYFPQYKHLCSVKSCFIHYIQQIHSFSDWNNTDYRQQITKLCNLLFHDQSIV